MDSRTGLNLTKLLEKEGVRPLRCPVRSGTLTDTGKWWRREHIRIVAHEEGILLWAPGPSPYHTTIAPEEMNRAFFNPFTGCLVVPTGDPHNPHRLRIPPSEAESILGLYRQQEASPESL